MVLSKRELAAVLAKERSEKDKQEAEALRREILNPLSNVSPSPPVAEAALIDGVLQIGTNLLP